MEEKMTQVAQFWNFIQSIRLEQNEVDSPDTSQVTPNNRIRCKIAFTCSNPGIRLS